MKSKILVITDEIENFKIIKDKFTLRRECDKPHYSSFKDAKQLLSHNCFDVVIAEEVKDFFKVFSFAQNSGAEVIMFRCDDGSDFEKYYQKGVFDCFNINAENSEFNNKILNCLKYSNLKRTVALNTSYFEGTGILVSKYKCFSLKYLREIFEEISQINDSVFCVITVDEDVKTKVLLKRLSGIIYKTLRACDIFAKGDNDSFYVVLNNVEIAGAKSFINILQSKIGNDIPIKAGLSKINYQTFEEALKNSEDALKYALKNGESLGIFAQDNTADAWLDTGFSSDKQYKLFVKAYERKLKNVIEPLFYRFKKENETKFNVIQYANASECAFCFKSEQGKSELVIHHGGNTVVDVQINHDGLNSPENSRFKITIDKLTEKELLKFLKNLKREFIKSRV